MPFYPTDAPVPHGIVSDDFLLDPLGPQHNPLDYDAVMASQEALLRRTEGVWPRHGFTPEENLADLEEHAADFQARTGFTYTVLLPDRERCLGCVYVYPLLQSLGRRQGAEDLIASTGEDVAYVWFWVRPEHSEDGLDERLVARLIPWLRNDFAFSRVVVFTWSSEERQITVLQNAGLRELWSLPEGNRRAIYFA